MNFQQLCDEFEDALSDLRSNFFFNTQRSCDEYVLNKFNGVGRRETPHSTTRINMKNLSNDESPKPTTTTTTTTEKSSSPETKKNILSTKWSIGLINEWNFLQFQEYLSSNSVEEIFQLFLRKGELNVRRCEMVTVLMPESLPVDIKFRPNLDNRFIFCSAEMNFHDAETMQKHFVLSLLLSIFPEIPNISAAFYYFDGSVLELGVYLTGIPYGIQVPVDRSIYRWPEDLALPVGHKLKQLILLHCPSCKNVDVTVTNAIPSDTSKYTDPIYEYQKSKRIFMKC